ncbi:hypothetical protein BGZ59_008061 [Podila verticillata]|nr:hypothetical protein BGZ59_008061 [Podila verticillata]KFH73371.1 hypothetical protein MVEG_00587 [Podila verticillata NRRL 6337]
MHHDAAVSDPLGLPEIRIHIGQFLDTRDILACILVCHAWAKDFSGFLWSTITFDKSIQEKLTKENFQRHESHIRKLTLLDHGSFLDDAWAGTHCSNVSYLAIFPDLTALSTRRRLLLLRSMEAFHLAENTDTDALEPTLHSSSQDEEQDPTAKKLMRLVEQQHHLRGLSENCAAVSRTCSNDFAKQLCRHPNRLVHLHLSKWNTTVPELNMLIFNSPHLEGLRFKGLVLLTPNSAQEIEEESLSSASESIAAPRQLLQFRQIRRLDLQTFHTSTPLLEIDCPEAVSIQLSGYDMAESFSPNIHQQQQHSSRAHYGHIWNCPKSRTLLYTGQAKVVEGPELKDTLTSILQSAHHLSKIVLACTLEIGPSVMSRILNDHSSTLTILHFPYSTGLTSSHILKVLTTCRNLVEFKGSEDYLVGQQLLLDPQPWVCIRLERLRVRFGLSAFLARAGHLDFGAVVGDQAGALVSREDTMKQEIQALYGQLSRLTRLTVLDLSGTGSVDRITRGIPWTMAAGLGQLSTLTNLETLHVTDWEREMGYLEAEWMVRHWPRLDNLYNLRNRDLEPWTKFVRFLRFFKEAKQSLAQETG